MKNKQHTISLVRVMIRAGAFLFVFLFCALAVYSQGGTARYVYDDNGRLLAVISPTGEANVYEYDAAGNFVAIRRLTTNDVAVFGFTPRSGLPGDLVTFVGIGFESGVSSVSFNGAAAQIVSVSASTVIATVPQAATTGTVSITTPLGTVATSTPFVIKGVRVSPASIKILPGDKVQFNATVSVGNADPSLVWSVNSVIGGNSTGGTITPSGLYTAPGQPMSGILVRATSVSVPSLFGEATVTVQNPDELRPVFSAGVTVQRAGTGGTLSQTGAFSRGVTIQLAGVAGVLTQSGVFSSGVTATKGPSISSITPTQVHKGAAVTITLNGINFAGATTVQFVNSSGSLDTTLLASNLLVSADGTSLSITVTVDVGASLGRRVVIVSTPAGKSGVANSGLNTLEVIQ